MTTTSLTDEQISYRGVIGSFKQQVKDDAALIRASKQKINQGQKKNGSGSESAEQWSLVRTRRDARARLLIYGALRGVSWDRIEINHGEPVLQVAHAIVRIWNASKAPFEVPALLLSCLPDAMLAQVK